MRLHIFTAAFIATSFLAFAPQGGAQLSPQPSPPPSEDTGAPDEPGRQVARLSVLSGNASVRRGDSTDWVAAALNAPLMVGDAVSVAPGAATEIQFDAAGFARLAGDSEVRIAEFETGRYQLQLAKGLVTYRVLRQTNVQAEILTALAAIRPLGLASVRVEVTPDGNTRVVVRHGDVEVSTRRGAERVHEGHTMLIQGTSDDPEFQIVNASGADQWDNWSDQRDAYLLRAQSPRYVSQDVYGTEDLDNYGRWSNDPAYGDVWTPAVSASWAPYRDGRWVWEDYYGWTWVDASPWGWAPFHYGSWYNRAGYGWSWFPGHRYERSWYRPALVGFFGFGDGGFGVGYGFGNIGWIPLAPYERFHPWYGGGYGRGGFGGGRNSFVNINIVHNTNISNVYRNSRFANGVNAVSGADFQRGNFRNQVAVGGAQLQRASMVRGALPVTPGGDHLRFSDRAQAGAGPRVDAGNQRFFSRGAGGNTGAAVGSQRVPFAQQQSAVRGAFENRGAGNSGSNTGDAGRRFGAGPSGPNTNAGPSGSPGWQRFGNPQASSPQRGFAAQENNGVGARFGGGQSRSLEVAPPIVNQRQNQGVGQGSQYSRPSYSGGGNVQRQSQPSYDQSGGRPARNYAPQNVAPRNQGGGGFGSPVYRSAPQQSAPSNRSAPAPRSSGGGGNGGGGNSGGGGYVGGGGNSGGHGNRR